MPDKLFQRYKWKQNACWWCLGQFWQNRPNLGTFLSFKNFSYSPLNLSRRDDSIEFPIAYIRSDFWPQKGEHWPKLKIFGPILLITLFRIDFRSFSLWWIFWRNIYRHFYRPRQYWEVFVSCSTLYQKKHKRCFFFEKIKGNQRQMFEEHISSFKILLKTSNFIKKYVCDIHLLSIIKVLPKTIQNKIFTLPPWRL